MAEKSNLLKRHHTKSSFVYNRPNYREARWERAVKVYTINLESKYLLVQGIPAVGATKELLELFALYGAIDEYRILDEYPAEEFTKVYWIKFQKIQSARFAKKKLDNRSFFGGILHVTYAPEFENVDDTREKLQERRKAIARKTRELFGPQSQGTCTSKSDEKHSSSSTNTSANQHSAPSVSAGGQLPLVQQATLSQTLKTDPAQSDPYSTNSTTNASGPFTWTYPTLPPPPQALHPFDYPPPPRPYEFPRVPSAHATLPQYLQNLPPPPPPPSTSSSTTTLATLSHGSRDIQQHRRAATTLTACRSSVAVETGPMHQAVELLPHSQLRNPTMMHSPSRAVPVTGEKPCLMGDHSLDSTAASVHKKMRMITSAPAVSIMPHHMDPLASERAAPAPAPVVAPKTKRPHRSCTTAGNKTWRKV